MLTYNSLFILGLFIIDVDYSPIKFELGGNKLNFLDPTVIKNRNKIEFDWFYNPTFSGRFLEYMLAHLISQKRGVITNMVDKVFRISYSKFHEKNLNLIIKTYIENDYRVCFRNY